MKTPALLIGLLISFGIQAQRTIKLEIATTGVTFLSFHRRLGNFIKLLLKEYTIKHSVKHFLDILIAGTIHLTKGQEAYRVEIHMVSHHNTECFQQNLHASASAHSICNQFKVCSLLHVIDWKNR